MITINKYQINPDPGQKFKTIQLPKEAKILSVDFQDEDLFIWALVDTSKPKETKTFYVVGTGWDCSIEAGLSHVATLQHNGFVWHIFT